MEPLVQAVRQGDPYAFRQLYEHYAPSVYRVALRLLGQAEEAEDVTQEVFLTLHQRIKGFDGRAAFSTWCYRLTVHACYDKMRKDKRRAPFQADSLDSGSSAEPYRPGRPEPLERAFAADVQRHVEHGLAHLHPDLRVTLVLRELEDQSYQEIAEVLRCSAGTVASRLARARQQMAAYLRTVGIDATYFT